MSAQCIPICCCISFVLLVDIAALCAKEKCCLCSLNRSCIDIYQKGKQCAAKDKWMDPGKEVVPNEAIRFVFYALEELHSIVLNS